MSDVFNGLNHQDNQDHPVEKPLAELSKMFLNCDKKQFHDF